MRKLTPDIARIDAPYMAVVMAADAGFMRLYRAGRRNTRRFARLALVLFPLVALLVGSCKGVSTAGSQNVLSEAEQMRAALFPDRAITTMKVSYEPAAGYISTARDFVAHAPSTLRFLTEREVSYLFGTPALTRRDAGARVVQYRGGPCVVDFYFYESDNSAQAMPVSHVDVRRRDGATAKAGCLGDIISRRPSSGA